jgi:hypothetical protein
MRDRSGPKASRVAPAGDPLLGVDVYDYSDAFEVQIADADVRPAVEWARCGLEQAPWAMRTAIVAVHRFVLGFRLAPRPSPDQVLGWRIVASERDLVQLEATSPLMRGVLIGRRHDPARMVLSTYLFFAHPTLAQAIWTAVGPLHRWMAPRLLERAAAGGCTTSRLV